MPEQNLNQNVPDWLPAKFWDEQTGEVRIEDLARSYRELERMKATPALANVPASPADYQLDVDDLLGIDDTANQRMYDEGFSNTQVQAVYDLAAERLVPMVQQIAQDADDAKQVDHLVRHFGGADRFEALRPQLRAWGEANLGTDVFETLAGSSEGVIAIHELMQNREPGLNSGTQALDGNNEEELKRMMADPRYWREREPAYVAKVREGFKSLYPEGVQ